MKTIEKNPDKELNTMDESIESLQNKCALLQQEKEELAAKLKWYEEQFRLSQEKRFGTSSEKMDSDQLSIFNEAEKESRPNGKEPDLEVITYKRSKAKGSKKKSFEDLPVEVVEYKPEDDEKVCPTCEGPLHEMSKKVRKELKIIPAQVKVVEHVRYVYTCRSCEKENTSTPIITAKMLNPVLPGSFVSPSLMAFIMNRKYA